jgi:hypothetical protein
MQAAGDHEVDGEPQAVIESQCDALAGAAQIGDGVPVKGGHRRFHRTQQKRAPDDGVPQAPPGNAGR